MGNLVQVAHYYEPEEAYCAKALLNAYDIYVFLQNDHHLTMAPWMRFALGGYRLLISSEDEAEAKELLFTDSDIKPVPLQHSEIESAGDFIVSEEKKRRNWLWFPIAFWSQVPFIPHQRSGWFSFVQSFLLGMVVILFFMINVFWGIWF